MSDNETGGVRDTQLAASIKTIRRRHEARAAEIKDELIEWLGRTVDPADTVAASLALLETAFDGYLDLHDEPDALDLITRTFRRVAQRRRGALQ